MTQEHTPMTTTTAPLRRAWIPPTVGRRTLIALSPTLATAVAWAALGGPPVAAASGVAMAGLFALAPALELRHGAVWTGHLLTGALIAVVALPVAGALLPPIALTALCVVPLLSAGWLPARDVMQWTGGVALMLAILAARAILLGDHAALAGAGASLGLLGTTTTLAVTWIDARTVTAESEQPWGTTAEAATLAALHAAVGAARKRDRFLALLSFELRTPLNAILGYSELLEEVVIDLSDPRSLSDARSIQRSSRRLLQVLDDVVDLASLDGDSEAVRASPIDLTATLQLGIDAALADHPNVRCTTELARGGLVLGDAIRLERLVRNLCRQVLKTARPRDPLRALMTRQRDTAVIVLEGPAGQIDRDGIDRLRDALSRPVDQRPLQLGLELSVGQALTVALGGQLRAERGSQGQLRLIVHLPCPPAFPNAS